MKIYILGPANPFRGGIAASSERLALQLIEEGHEVQMINFTVQYPNFLFPGKTQFTDSPAPKKLKIRRLFNSFNPLNWFKVGRQIAKEKPDILISRFWLPFMAPSTGTICKIVRNNKHTKIISIVDNLLPHETRPGDKIFTNYYIKQNHGLIAMSKSVFEDLDLFRKNQPKKLTPHPIYDHYGDRIQKEDAIKKLNLDPNFNYILFFGFIRDYKGLDILLESLTNPKLKDLNIKLIIAGEYYSNEEKYSKLIKDLQLEEKVLLYTSYIPDDQINLYFCASDMVTQTYKSATQSGVTQIAYHFHKPMLVTNVGGLPEIVNHMKNGYVVDPSPAPIADALLDFYSNKREASMITQVIEAKQKFMWNNLTKAIFEINSLCS